MSDWEHVRSYLRERYRLARDQPEWLGLVWNLGTEAEPLPQRTKVELISAFEEPWLLVMGEVCSELAFPHRDALLHNAQLAVGALAIEQSCIVVRQTLRLATLVWEDLDWTLQIVALEALTLRRALPFDTSLFSHFAD